MIVKEPVLTPTLERVLACTCCGQAAFWWPSEPAEGTLYMKCPNCGADEFRSILMGKYQVSLRPLAEILMEAAHV